MRINKIVLFITSATQNVCKIHTSVRDLLLAYCWQRNTGWLWWLITGRFTICLNAGKWWYRLNGKPPNALDIMMCWFWQRGLKRQPIKCKHSSTRREVVSIQLFNRWNFLAILLSIPPTFVLLLPSNNLFP